MRMRRRTLIASPLIALVDDSSGMPESAAASVVTRPYYQHGDSNANKNATTTTSLSVMDERMASPTPTPRTVSPDTTTTSIGDDTELLSTPPVSRSTRVSLRRKLLGDNADRSRRRRHPRPAVVGHRGAPYDFLENTRASFVRCAELGCHAVELDVFGLSGSSSSSDNNVVVVFHGGGSDARPGLLHDYCLPHTIGGNAADYDISILDLTFQQTQQLRFNPDCAEFPCPKSAVEAGRVPLLRDVLRDLSCFPNLEVKIELKGHGTAMVQSVLDLVEQFQMPAQCSYSSFDFTKLRELRRLRPDATRYPTGALFAGVPPPDFVARAVDCGATQVHLKYDECTAERVAAIHRANLASMAWWRGPVGMVHDAQFKYRMLSENNGQHNDENGNDDECVYRAVLDTGVQQLCCNRPDVLLQLLAAEEEKASSASSALLVGE